MTNPYQPAKETDEPARGVRLIDAVAWLCPVPFFLAVYAAWTIAVVSLSRAPEIGRDRPSDVAGEAMSVALSVVDLLAAITVPILAVAMLLQIAIRGVPLRTRLGYAGLSVVALGLYMIAMALEPTGAFRWLILSDR